MKLQAVASTNSPTDRRDWSFDWPHDCLGDPTGDRVLLLGLDIGLMRTLLQRGCHRVTELEQHERPDAHSFELVVVPTVSDAEAAMCAIAHARWGLVPSGRILLRTEAGPSGLLGRTIERTLTQHGFSLIRVRRAGHRAIFSAELPMPAPLPRALAQAA